MIGIASAAVLASAAGARRTDTAYARFREATNGFDAMAVGCAGGVPWPSIPVGTKGLPQVRDYADLYYRMGYAAAPDGRVLFTGKPSLEYGITGMSEPADYEKLGMKVLEGRLADPSNPNEVTIGYVRDPSSSAEVGSTVDYYMLRADSIEAVSQGGGEVSPEVLTDPIPLKVVGTTLMSGPGGEVRGDSFDIVGTPAFLEKYGSLGPDCGGQLFWLKDGLAAAPAFISAAQDGSPEAMVLSSADEATFVNRNTRVQTVSLWLFAGLLAVAGLIIFGQALARQTAMEATENPILRALGMTRWQIFAVAMLRSLSIGLVAATVAIVLAVAVSGSVITGIAALVEPDPGISPDWPILLGGFAFVVLAVLLIATIPAWRATRVRGDVLGTSIPERARRPSVIAAVASQAGASPSMVSGMRLALEPGRGRSAVPVRSAVVGLVLALVALVASMTFASSFQHLITSPELVGFTFDTGAGNPFAPPMRDEVRPLFAEDPGLENVAAGNFSNQIRMVGPAGEDIAVNAWGLEQIKGSQHPPTSEGSWPGTEGEVALGAKTMRQVGAGIGDTVTVSAGGATADLKVVGKAVFPDFGFGPGLGEGAGMTFNQLKQFFPDEDQNLYLADIVPGADFSEINDRIAPTLDKYGAGGESGRLMRLGEEFSIRDSQSLQQATRSQSLPTMLAGVVALMAAAMLAHTLVSSIRRRRRDLAILKTLGFTRGQVSATVAWQASTLILVSLAIGVPLGLMTGRWAWNLFVDQLGAVPQVVIPVGSVILLVPISLLIANLIAVLPGRSAGRTQPSVVLRSE